MEASDEDTVVGIGAIRYRVGLERIANKGCDLSLIKRTLQPSEF